jgi:hypothetical protein
MDGSSNIFDGLVAEVREIRVNFTYDLIVDVAREIDPVRRGLPLKYYAGVMVASIRARCPVRVAPTLKCRAPEFSFGYFVVT